MMAKCTIGSRKGCERCLPHPAGMIAYTAGEALHEAPAAGPSELRVFQMEPSRSEVLLNDPARVLTAQAFSPDESRLTYIPQVNRSDWPLTTVGILDLSSRSWQELDTGLLASDAVVRGLAWLDDHQMVLLIQRLEAGTAELYTISAGGFSTDQMEKSAEFALEPEFGMLDLIYAPRGSRGTQK